MLERQEKDLKMLSKSWHTVALFLGSGLLSGMLTALLSQISFWVMWAGAGLVFLVGLAMAYGIATKKGEVFVIASRMRYFVTAVSIVSAYPLSVVVMFAGYVVYDWLFATVSPAGWQERAASGDYYYSMLPLFGSAIAAGALVSLALRVLTGKWDKLILFLMVLAGIVTIPISRTISELLHVLNYHLVLFPVGQALFCALSGAWLLKNRLDKSSEHPPGSRHRKGGSEPERAAAV